MCRSLPVGEAHDIADHIEREVAGTLPGAHVMMHIEPCSGSETPQCRIADRPCAFVQQAPEAVAASPLERRETK